MHTFVHERLPCLARTYLHAHTHIGTHVCAQGSTNARVHTHTYFSCKQGLLTSWQESKVSRHAKVWTRIRPCGAVRFHAGDNSRSFLPAPRRGVSSPQGQFLRTQLIRNNSFTIIISVRFGSRAPSSCRTERARETEENPPEHWATRFRKPAQAELPGQPPRAEGRSAVTTRWPLTPREQELRSAYKTCGTPWLPRTPSGACGQGHTPCSRPTTGGWPELPCKHAFQEASPGRAVGTDHSHPATETERFLAPSSHVWRPISQPRYQRTNEMHDANFVNLEVGVFLQVPRDCLFRMDDTGNRLSRVSLPKIHMLNA